MKMFAAALCAFGIAALSLPALHAQAQSKGPDFRVEILRGNKGPTYTITNLSAKPVEALVLEVSSSSQPARKVTRAWDSILEGLHPIEPGAGLSRPVYELAFGPSPDKIKVVAAVWTDGKTFGAPASVNLILNKRATRASEYEHAAGILQQGLSQNWTRDQYEQAFRDQPDTGAVYSVRTALSAALQTAQTPQDFTRTMRFLLTSFQQSVEAAPPGETHLDGCPRSLALGAGDRTLPGSVILSEGRSPRRATAAEGPAFVPSPRSSAARDLRLLSPAPKRCHPEEQATRGLRLLFLCAQNEWGCPVQAPLGREARAPIRPPETSNQEPGVPPISILRPGEAVIAPSDLPALSTLTANISPASHRFCSPNFGHNTLAAQIAPGGQFGMRKINLWLLFFSGISALGGLACILEWLGIKPKDLAMSQSIPVPHVLWLLLALTLFAIAIGSAIWSGIVQRRQIEQLRNAAAMPPPIGRENVLATTSPIAVEAPQYRLKIHSASYGSGNTFKPVDQYLRKHATDALSARIDANLFDAYDPTPGDEKDLTVVYSFEDEKKHTIQRHEKDWLALPEDPEFCFSALQRRAIKLARLLRKLIVENPAPPQLTHAASEKETTAYMVKYAEWHKKLSYCYESDFADQVLKLRSTIGRQNPNLASRITPIPGAFPPPNRFEELAKVLWDLAWDIEEIQSGKTGV